MKSKRDACVITFWNSGWGLASAALGVLLIGAHVYAWSTFSSYPTSLGAAGVPFWLGVVLIVCSTALLGPYFSIHLMMAEDRIETRQVFGLVRRRYGPLHEYALAVARMRVTATALPRPWSGFGLILEPASSLSGEVLPRRPVMMAKAFEEVRSAADEISRACGLPVVEHSTEVQATYHGVGQFGT